MDYRLDASFIISIERIPRPHLVGIGRFIDTIIEATRGVSSEVGTNGRVFRTVEVEPEVCGSLYI